LEWWQFLELGEYHGCTIESHLPAGHEMSRVLAAALSTVDVAAPSHGCGTGSTSAAPVHSSSGIFRYPFDTSCVVLHGGGGAVATDASRVQTSAPPLSDAL